MANDFMIPLSSAKLLLPGKAGGKASALSEMIGKGFNVPRGFVVTVAAIQALVEAQVGFRGLLECDRRFRQSKDKNVAEFTYALRQFISNMECPDWFSAALAARMDSMDTKLFAVRSSGAVEDGVVQSWAGMFDSFLAVPRDDVFRRICMCCASYFSDRSIAYQENVIPNVADMQFAVLVQEMVAAEASCVVFSEDPIDPSKVRIEATEGLGQELVSGRITPDSYLLDRSSGVLVESTKGSKASEDMPVRLLWQIYDVAMAVEAAFGFSVDIELAIADEKVFVLQARKITSTASNTNETIANGLPNIANYVLTFKVQGLDFLFSDMLARGFGYLDPLFVSFDGDFRQYFPREKMRWAALEGYRWLREESGFSDYERSYRGFNVSERKQLSTLVSSKLDARTLLDIFEIFAAIMSRYSRMDFPFTNLVWHYADTDRTIAANLDRLSTFKDNARVWLNEILLDENSYYAKTVELIAEALQRTSSEVVNLSISEIAEELAQGQKTPPYRVKNRQKSFAIYVRGGEARYVDDLGLISRRFSQNLPALGESRRLYGQVANRTSDVIEGVVRVINVDYANLEKMQCEMNEMNPGEILVAEFTAPELLPACKKARAIVTDLGGMLSHAAIVSRELGIPCLVGTGEAASVFETGDFVLVDLAASSISHAGRIEEG